MRTKIHPALRSGASLARRSSLLLVVTLLVAAGLVVLPAPVNPVASLAPERAAEAYELPTSANAAARSITYPSGLTVTASTTGFLSTDQLNAGSTVFGSSTYGYTASDYSPAPPPNSPGFEPIVNWQCTTYGLCSTPARTMTFTFNRPVLNPRMHIDELGGNTVQLLTTNTVSARLRVTTPGITPTLISGRNLQITGGNTIEATNKAMNLSCTTTSSPPGCGTVELRGLVSSVTFDITMFSALQRGTSNPTVAPLFDGFPITFTVPQDYGDAPSSYDQGDAARAVISDVKLGPTVTEDNANVANGTSSPNASSTASLDGGDDGVVLPPITRGTTTYPVPVTISGATSAGTVCGWIDTDGNGTFETSERQCTTYAAGATSATLTWSLSGLTAMTTFARFRVGPNAAQVQLPIGPADAGEVEDHALVIPPGYECVNPSIFIGYRSPTQLVRQDQTAVGATFTDVGAAASLTYNAIAFNDADGFIYGVTPAADSSPGRLVRIDPTTGGVTVLGSLSGVGTTLANSNITSGAFDDAGNYWVANYANNKVYRIDLTTRVATGIAGQTTNWLSFDMAYAQGFMWGYNASNNRIQRLDLTTGAIVGFVPPAGMPGGTDYGAAWTYGNGNIGFDRNTGGVYQLAIANAASASPTFTIVSTSSGPASSNNDGTACIPGPVDLSIEKSGPAVVAPSGTVTWTLTVRNEGPNNSSGFVIDDAVPAAYTNVTTTTPGCTVTGNALKCVEGALAVGESYVITLSARAPATLGCITNTATVFGNEEEIDTSNNTSSTPTCVAVANLTIDKAIVGAPVANGDGTYTVTYDISVTNDGASSVAGLEVVDPLAGAVTCLVDQLAPGDSTDCAADVAYPITAADEAAGQVRNIAHATALDQGGAPVRSNDDETITPVDPVVPGLVITKEVVGEPVPTGGSTWTVRYRIRVRNEGEVPERYDLVDTMRPGDGMSVLSTTVLSTDPSSIEVNEAWDGITDTTVAERVALPVDGVHAYLVEAVLSVPSILTAEAADCALDDGEQGTGLLNQADALGTGSTSTAQACAPLGLVTVDKSFVGAPVVGADGSVVARYRLVVSNPGAETARYDLRDDLAWAVGLDVSGAVVVAAPAGLAAEAGWDGAGRPELARGVPLAPGEVHRWELEVRGAAGLAVEAGADDCVLSSTETGSGLLNVATVSANGSSVRDDACEPLGPSLADGAGDGSSAGGPDGELVRSGWSVGALLVDAASCLAVGMAALVAARRRRRGAPSIRPA